MDTGPLSIKDVCEGNVAEMSWLERANWQQRQSPIPPALKDNVLAWWEAGYQRDVVLGMNQLIPAMVDTNANNLADGWTCTGTALNFSNGVQKWTADSQNDVCFYGATPDVAGIKYYLSMRVKSSSNNVRIVLSTSPTQIEKNHTGSGNFENLSLIFTTPANPVYFRASVQDTRASAWDEIQFEKPLLYNLTAIFGAGNEPTAAEMDAILAQDGNQYWEGTRNVKVNPAGKYYAYDASGNGRIAKLYNMAYNAASGPQAGPPKYWKCDGVDDWMGSLNLPAPIAAGAEYTVIAIVKAGRQDELLRCINAAGLESATFWINGSNILYGSVKGTTSVDVSTSVNPINAWQACAITHKEGTVTVRIGSASASKTLTGALGISGVRAGYNGSSGYSTEAIGAVSILDKALSGAEWASVHNKLATRFGLTPIA